MSSTTTVVSAVLLLQVATAAAAASTAGAGGGVKLVCRSDESLRVRWEAVSGAASYRLQLQSRPGEEWTPLPDVEADATVATVANLSAASQYRVSVTAAAPDASAPAVVSDWMTTLPANAVPGPARDVRVTQRRGAAPASVDAVVTWSPPPELPCLYEVTLWIPSEMRVRHRELHVSGAPPGVEFRGLRFLAEYRVIVVSKGANLSLESSVAAPFHVADCLDWFNDTDACPPPAPVRLSAEARRRHKSVHVRWGLAVGRPPPRAFFVSLSTERGAKVASRSLPGWATATTFEDLEVDAATVKLLVTVQAQAPGGNSSSHVWTTHHLATHDDDKSSGLPLLVATALLALGAAGAALLAGVVARRRRRDSAAPGRRPPEAAAAAGGDRWEVASERLLLGPVLGEGAFGVVRRGRLDSALDVAVKMLREDASAEDVRQFEREIDMVKSVGPHPHVVSIVGCVTAAPRMRLIVEFCALGDLHNYLHNAWLHINQFNESDVVSPKASGEHERCPPTGRNLVINQIYDLQRTGVVCLEASDLLSFARQIAMGMEFLAGNHVLHRDLAARNVLVCDRRVVKISDFGLSRDVYEQNVYRTSGDGRLPVKWMALESLMHRVFTSQSDVWSFGVLLWEIVTLGANPYPSTPTGRVLKLLRTGYRMECPGNCSPQLYEIMLSCWRVKPRDRPTFSQLRSQLDLLLESGCPHQYLNLDVSVT